MTQKKNRAQITEIVGIVAVVLGLVFVGLELAQNTAATRAQTVQAVQLDLRNQLNFSKELAEISMKSPEERTLAEALMRRQYFFRAMRSYENQWYHYSQGYLDEHLFRAYQQHLRITIGLENYREIWDERKQMGFFHPGFVDYVDEYLLENPPLPEEWMPSENDPE
jgi:hypothetical protein